MSKVLPSSGVKDGVGNGVNSGVKVERVFFLGPKGSQSESAARQWVKTQSVNAQVPSLEGEVRELLQPCFSLGEIVERLFAEPELGAVGILPIENVLEGPVTETLDLLFDYRERLHVWQAFLVPIVHGLGTLPGGADEPIAIKEVLSHPQALRQCQRGIREYAPGATTTPARSTAEAAERVALGGAQSVAAIAHPDTLRENGLTVRVESIADASYNRTRFIVVSLAKPPSSLSSEKAGQWVTSVVVNPRMDRQGLLYEILGIISQQFGLNVLSIHSRPDKNGGFLFYLELEGRLHRESGEGAIASTPIGPTRIAPTPIARCIQRLREYCRVQTNATAECVVLGSFPSPAYFERGIKRVLIIGGEGRMGRWFARFFRGILGGAEAEGRGEGGGPVRVWDLSSDGDLEAQVGWADLVLLSIPRQEVLGVVDRIAPSLKSGALLVENCSIKGEILNEIRARTRGDVEVLGIHTLFGPSFGSGARGRHERIGRAGKIERRKKRLRGARNLRGGNIIFCPVIDNTLPESAKQSANQIPLPPLSEELKGMLYGCGADVTLCSPEEHDRMMALTQSALHFGVLGYASTLLGESTMEQLEPFLTHNAHEIIEIARRLVAQSPELLLVIQHESPLAGEMRGRLMSELRELGDSLEEGVAKLAAVIAGLKQRLSGVN